MRSVPASKKTRLSNMAKPEQCNDNVFVQAYGTHVQAAPEVKTFNTMMSTPKNKKSTSKRG